MYVCVCFIFRRKHPTSNRKNAGEKKTYSLGYTYLIQTYSWIHLAFGCPLMPRFYVNCCTYKLWIDTLNEWESVSSIKQCIETLAVAFLLVYIFMFLILQLCVFLCLTDGGKESEKERKRERKQQTLTEHNKMTCSRSHFALFVCSVAVWQYLMEID